MKLEISEDERDDLITALNMRINFVETGNPLLSRGDVIEQNASVIVRQGAHKITAPETTAMLKTLRTPEPSQIALVARMTRVRDVLLGVYAR